MLHLGDDDVRNQLDWASVLAALDAAFREREGYRTPERVAIAAPQGGTFLTMPCADAEGYFGVKQVAVLPDNRSRGLPSVQAHYTLFAPDGRPALSCSATLLTRIRTAAASALAARVLAPTEAAVLLVCGSGSLAPWMAVAHAQVRSYQRIVVWGRSREGAEATAAEVDALLAESGGRAQVGVADDLAAAVAEADTISCATTARTPFLRGAWLHGGHHLDLVGAFTPEMAEADPEAVRSSEVWVDDRAGVRAEAGDLLAAEGDDWSLARVRGDLAELLRADFERSDRPTLFKSVGLALEDLAVARLLL